MALVDYEVSTHDGRPAECFKFNYLDNEWRYSSLDSEPEIDGEIYDSTYISRSKLNNENDMFKTTLTVTTTLDNPVALLFRGWVESSVVLTLYKLHLNDPDKEALVLWSGRVASCDFKKEVAELACVSLYSSTQKKGLVRPYGRNCPHVHYAPNSCRLVEADHTVIRSVQGTSGNTITFDAAGLTEGYYAGGSCTIGTARRMVLSNTSNSVTLMDGIAQAQAGDEAALVPGCDRSIGTCRNKFGNNYNFGGFPHIPGKNPFRVSLLG